MMISKQIANIKSMKDITKIYDKTILDNCSKFINMKNFKTEMLIEKANDEITAKENIHKFYSTKSWFYPLKERSQVIGKLLSAQKILAKKDITIDNAVLTLCSFLNFINSNTWFKLPDKFLITRNQLSKQKLDHMLSVFKELDILDVKRENNETLIKLNRSMLEQDKYIMRRKASFKKSDKTLLTNMYKNGESVYYCPITTKTKFLNWKRVIIGITYSYNNYIENIVIDKVKQKDPNSTYGHRQDIKYVEVPVHILKSVLRVPESKVRKYLNKLCKGTNYIKKHDKVYIDSGNMEHYYNFEYQLCDLANYDSVQLEESHPAVTENSYILFMNNLKNTNVFKYVEKHMDDYDYLVLQEIFKYVEYNKYDNENDEVIETEKQFFEYEELDKDKAHIFNDRPDLHLVDLTKIHHITYDTYTPRMKFDSRIMKTLSFEKCIKTTMSILNRIMDETKCNRNHDINYYIKKFNIFKDRVLELYNKNKTWPTGYEEFGCSILNMNLS